LNFRAYVHYIIGAGAAGAGGAAILARFVFVPSGLALADGSSEAKLSAKSDARNAFMLSIQIFILLQYSCTKRVACLLENE